MRPEPADTLQRAITLVTAALESDRDEGRLRDETLLELVTEPEGDYRLIQGLVNLALILLVRLEKATGTRDRQLLRDVALHYQPPPQ